MMVGTLVTISFSCNGMVHATRRRVPARLWKKVSGDLSVLRTFVMPRLLSWLNTHMILELMTWFLLVLLSGPTHSITGNNIDTFRKIF